MKRFKSKALHGHVEKRGGKKGGGGLHHTSRGEEIDLAICFNCPANVELTTNYSETFDKSTDMIGERQGHLPEMTSNPWATKRICPVYDNPWIEVTHRDVINPTGGAGIYGVVHFKNLAIGIVPLDAAGNTWLVGQYRYTLGRYSWEIPEGGGPLDVSPLETAQRELMEETGIRAKTWTKLLDMHLSNSVTDEIGVAFVAQGLEFGEAQPEETEQLQVRRVPFDEALHMVLDGEITDALSMAALLKTNEWLRRGVLSV